MNIQKVFHQYFTILYKGEEVSSEKVDEYLQKQNLSKITDIRDKMSQCSVVTSTQIFVTFTVEHTGK